MVFLFGIFSKFGSFLARFRKKKTVIETLEDIDKQIKDFEKYKLKNELNERKYIGALVLYSILLYIFGAAFYYFYLLPKNLTDRAKTIVPFLISPILIYSLRRFLKWFFIKRKTYYAKKLEDLREEKKTILEDVKENETYKKAKEILERFGSGVDISITPPSTPSHNKTIYNQQAPGTNLVHRNVKNMQQQQQQQQQQQHLHNTSKLNLNATVNPSLNTTVNNKSGSNASINNTTINQTNSLSQQIPTQTLGPVQQQQQQSQQIASNNLAPTPQARTILPRPIITPNRTFFDKVLDFIIGEGPNNRYALICKNCHFHNGMALREEFEYIAFRCAYCLFYNEARKTKLSVPKFSNKTSTENTISIQTNQNNDSMGSSSLSTSNSLDDLSEGLNKEPESNKIKEAEAIKLTSNGNVLKNNDLDISDDKLD